LTGKNKFGNIGLGKRLLKTIVKNIGQKTYIISLEQSSGILF